MIDVLVSCGDCTHFAFNTRNEYGLGCCTLDACKGTRSLRWPADKRAPPAYPRAERFCMKFLRRAAA